MKPKHLFLWLGFLALGLALTVGIVFMEGEQAELTALGWAGVLLGFAPLIAAQLALGVPALAETVAARLNQSRAPLAWTAGAVSGLWLLTSLLAGHFDPYATVIVAVGLTAALGTLRQTARGQRGLTWSDLAIWLLLWIPFDLRWNYDLWFGFGGGYNWWALALSVLGVLGWGLLRELPDFGYRLVPRWADLRLSLLATAVFAAIVIPLGLAIDFLQFPPSQPPAVGRTVFLFIGLALTVAIPEELFFRGVLLHGMDQMSERRGWMLFLNALAFGLMHWNNAGSLEEKIAYVALATLAGAFYGWTYRRSGNNLLAPVLTHALVDTLWAVLLS